MGLPQRRPNYDLHVRALGELGIERSDGAAVPERGRGGRVQQLLGALIVSRSIRRTDLATGELLPLVDLESIEQERRRLQSTAYNAGCRVGELLLAKSEPEEALAALFRAARIDPIAERASRIEIRCHLALGSTSSARATTVRLLGVLEAEGLSPHRETQIVLERLGL